MTHAMIQKAGIGAHGLWSVSRGLARGLQDRTEYRFRMDAADQPRRGDLDGRGNLSLAALEGYTEWFLSVMLDQIRLTASMLDMRGLEARYVRLIGDLFPEAPRLAGLVRHVLRFGEILKGDLPAIIGVKERAARNDLARLAAGGFLKSDGHRTPVRIGFPVESRERLFPNLFAAADAAGAPARPLAGAPGGRAIYPF